VLLTLDVLISQQRVALKEEEMFGYSFEEERALHESVAWGMLLMAIPTYITLAHVVPQPWGKTLDTQNTSNNPWYLVAAPMLPARLAWFIFESPNLFWSFMCWKHRRETLPWTNQLLLGLFVLHYIQRSIVYPLLISSHTKRIPSAVVLSATVYTNFNG
jgi:hypothetical protein